MKPVGELGRGAEFDRIRAIWYVLGDRAGGYGDDCAIIDVGVSRLAISTDCSVEGTHFRVGWLSHRSMGYRAAAAALSDLAACAATPLGILVNLGLPPDVPDEFVSDLMDGCGDAASAVGAFVWGGDLYRSDLISIGVSVVGAPGKNPVLRSGATPGDSVWVTGQLGGAAAAVRSLEAGKEPPAAARERFEKPIPRVGIAARARDAGATAMIDLSDGLVSDADHISAASNVAVVIDAEAVPVHPEASTDLALSGGEDYELLFTMPGAVSDSEIRSVVGEESDVMLTRIGRVEQGRETRFVLDGQQYSPDSGFAHF